MRNETTLLDYTTGHTTATAATTPAGGFSPLARPHTAAVDRVEALAHAFPTRIAEERRRAPRIKYHVVATLETAGLDGGAVPLYTRDADANGSGFVTNAAGLSEGDLAVMHLPTPDGAMKRVECRVRRSRAVEGGWYEGSVEFLGEQPVFSDQKICA